MFHLQRFSVRIHLLLGLLLAGAALFAPRPALAAGVVGDGTPGSCTDAAIAAVFVGGSGTITFNCGPSPVTILMTTKVIGNGQTFVVDGGGKVTLDGLNLVQLFSVNGSGSLTLKHITLARGGQFDGGGVRVLNSSGFLRLENVTINNCGFDADEGGAIHNAGTLQIVNSILIDNEVDERGGAIFNGSSGVATIVSSEVRANRVINPVGTLADGAGIYNLGTLTIERSAINYNRAVRDGGGIFTATGSASIINSTISENTADFDPFPPEVHGLGSGGGIYAGSGADVTLLNNTIVRNNSDTAANIWVGGPVQMKNTIVAEGSSSADNGTTSLNCDNSGVNLVSNGHNLIGDNTCVDGSIPTDLRNTSPNLLTIDFYGGTTSSRMPKGSSPAVNAGDNSGCPAIDQRDVARPQLGTCDIGAVEITFLEQVSTSGTGAYLPFVDK